MSDLNQNPKSFFLSPKTSLKKTLVLDLDETLVHSQFLPFPIQSDVILKIDIENQLHDIHVLIRPGVSTFLQRLSKFYEIVIFTASVSKYAATLLDIIDKDNICSFRLYREHCTMKGITYVKDLNKLGRNLKDVIIVDNSPLSYSFNKENGIPILTWFNDKNDRELLKLLPILEFLSCVNDVRDYIKNIVINNTISYENVINIINNYSKINNDSECKKYINEIICNLSPSNYRSNITNVNIIETDKICNNEEKNNGYINITISNNEINNYLYFSPIYTINNNIKNSNLNNNAIDNLDIIINNEYDMTQILRNNQKEIKIKESTLNSKINKTKSKDVFNKIKNKGKSKIKRNDNKMKQIKFISKNNIQKNIKINNIINKTINNVLKTNSNDSKDYTLDSNILDLKTIISSTKRNQTKNFRLPKTPEIEQILYNTNNNKIINYIILKRIGFKTGRGNWNNNEGNKNKKGKNYYRNSINRLKHKIELNINHEKHKSFNHTDLNFDSNLFSLKKNNIVTNNIFHETNLNNLSKNSSHSKNKFSNTLTINSFKNKKLNMNYSKNSFHKKAVSSQIKIIGITEIANKNKVKKLNNYNLQINTSNSIRNNRIKKTNTINKTICDRNFRDISLKKYYNMNSNASKKNNLLNIKKKIFNPIYSNKIKKFPTNIKDFSDYNNTIRHKKTLSFNGDIFPLHKLNRTSSSSLSKRIKKNKSNNMDNMNILKKRYKNKKPAKKIKINLNDLQKNKINKIKKIKEVKFINISDNSNYKTNKFDLIDNIIFDHS